MNYIKILTFLSAVGFLTCYPFYKNFAVFAQENNDLEIEEDINKPLTQKLYDNPYESLENIGLPKLNDTRNLGKDLYRGSRRSSLTEFVKNMPLFSDSRIVQQLTNHFLLTSPNIKAIINDAPITPGEDLFTLRLKILLDRGLLDELVSLYTAQNEEPYNEQLATTGAYGMLLSGNRSLGCLEIKTAFAHYGDHAPWNVLNRMCSIIENDAASISKLQQPSSQQTEPALRLIDRIMTEQNFSVSYDPHTFESFSVIERAILIATQRITLDNANIRNLSSIPAAHIQSLLSLDTLSADSQLYLLSKGIEKSVIGTEALAKRFRQLHEEDNSHDLPLVDLYDRLSTASDIASENDVAKAALSLSDLYGPSALTPFSIAISHLPPNSMSLQEYVTALYVLNMANVKIPSSWQIFLSQSPPEYFSETYNKDVLIMISYLMSERRTRTDAQKAEMNKIFAATQNRSLLLVKNIIENIDNVPSGHDNVAEVYENGFDTAENKGYFKPSDTLLSRLSLSSQNQAIGETILLSSLVLKEAPLNAVSPAVLLEVTRSLETIGLTETSDAFVTELLFEGLDLVYKKQD